jgi:Dolichyl-phosphate-mannose-protein mannosyltransferase
MFSRKHAFTDKKGMRPEIKWPDLRTVLIVGALLRLSSIVVVRSFLHPQTWEFGLLAENLVGGLGYSDLMLNGTYQPSIYMPPGYPLFLAFFYRIGGQQPVTFLVITVIQAGLGVLLVHLVYRLALIVMGTHQAILAACLAALYPTQVYMCNEFHAINIYIVLQVATVFFLVRYVEISASWGDLVMAGLCAGTLMFFRGESPALVLLYAAVLLLRERLKFAKPALVFLLIAFACLAPWTLRNYRVFGRVVLVCASGGVNLWIGNNSLATGDDRYGAADIVRGDFARGAVSPDEFEQLPSEIRQAFSRIPIGRNSQIEKDEVLKHLALNFMRGHPKEAAILLLKKLFAFFVFDPRHEKGREAAYWLPSVLLSILAILGVVLRRKTILLQDLLLVVSILFAVVIGLIVFVLPRYKMVIDPFIMIFAAAGMSGIFRRRTSGESQKSTVSIASTSR